MSTVYHGQNIIGAPYHNITHHYDNSVRIRIVRPTLYRENNNANTIGKERFRSHVGISQLTDPEMKLLK